MAEVRLLPAAAAQQPLIRRMVADYLDEMGLEAPIARGSVPLYWREAGRWPFLIRADEATVGFALVRRDAEGFVELAEFSVLPAHRNRGLGAAAARAVFARFPGRWRLKAVPGAARFWDRTLRAAGFAARDLGGGWRAFTVPGGGEEIMDTVADRLGELWFDPAQVFIGGVWRDVDAHLPLEDPSTGAGIGRIARGGAAEIDAAVRAARVALDGAWGRTTAAERGRILARIGQMVLARADDLAALEASDVGKPLKQAKADALALARYMEFYAGAADKVMGETIPYLEGYTVYTLREPHGVTGHIVPWNYPMQIIGRSVGAALAMGNACVLKPAEEACLTALAFARLAEAAGLPPGALNVVPGLGEEAGAALTAHPGVNHISFTGSVGVGRLVQVAAAENIVPVTLELGGKSPQVVFADADLDKALPFLVNAGIQNAGQTCSASSRILVERPLYDRVVARMAQRYAALKVGPARADLDVGPLISARQKEIVEGFLAMASGAEVVARGQIAGDAPAGGHYVAPTLMAGLSPDHRLAQDEIFGPAQVILPFEDEEEAVAIANGTDYGLVASIWSENGGRQMRLAKRLRAGQVFVNNYGAGGGVELPFGGTGKSGHGREKGFEALYGFSTLKTVAAHHG